MNHEIVYIPATAAGGRRRCSLGNRCGIRSYCIQVIVQCSVGTVVGTQYELCDSILQYTGVLPTASGVPLYNGGQALIDHNTNHAISCTLAQRRLCHSLAASNGRREPARALDACYDRDTPLFFPGPSLSELNISLKKLIWVIKLLLRPVETSHGLGYTTKIKQNQNGLFFFLFPTILG